MADRLLRAQVTIPMDGALPEDYIVNTFHFDGDDLPEEVHSTVQYAEDVVTLLTTFYNAIDALLFPATVNTPAVVRVYDMRDPKPRVPVLEDTIDLVPSADPMFPGEVALVGSFRAAPVSGVPIARRTGRIFFGPIKNTAGGVVASQNRPLLATREQLRDAMNTLADGLLIGAGPERVRWAIYSPAIDAGASIDDAFNDVVSGWVDDAWDTMRSRGCAPTSRVTFS